MKTSRPPWVREPRPILLANHVKGFQGKTVDVLVDVDDVRLARELAAGQLPVFHVRVVPVDE